MSDCCRPHGLHHIWLPCPSLSPRVCLKSCLLGQWYHPIISSSVGPFSSCQARSQKCFLDHGSFGVFTSIFSSLRVQAERGCVLIIPFIPKAGTREYALWYTDIYICFCPEGRCHTYIHTPLARAGHMFTPNLKAPGIQDYHVPGKWTGNIWRTIGLRKAGRGFCFFLSLALLFGRANMCPGRPKWFIQ